MQILSRKEDRVWERTDDVIHVKKQKAQAENFCVPNPYPVHFSERRVDLNLGM